MSVDFATKYFNTIHNVLNNGQHPLVRATKKVGTHAATCDCVVLVGPKHFLSQFISVPVIFEQYQMN